MCPYLDLGKGAAVTAVTPLLFLELASTLGPSEAAEYNLKWRMHWDRLSMEIQASYP